MTNPTLFIVGLALLVTSSMACTCRKPTLWGAYCANSGFLILAKVIDMTNPILPQDKYVELENVPYEEKDFFIHTYGSRRYTLDVKKTYRNGGVDISPVSILEARIAESICGVQLKQNTTYLLSGSIVNGVMMTRLCNYREIRDTPLSETPVCLPSAAQTRDLSGVEANEVMGGFGGLGGFGIGMFGSPARSEVNEEHKRLSILDVLSEE